MTSVIRIQISVCTSQDIGAPKRAINRDTLLVRENSIYVKNSSPDDRLTEYLPISISAPLSSKFSIFFRFAPTRPDSNEFFLSSEFIRKSVEGQYVCVCVCARAVYDGATKEKENGGFVSSIHSSLLPGSRSARKCLGRVKTNSLFRAPPRNFATSSSAIWPIAIHGVSRGL